MGLRAATGLRAGAGCCGKDGAAPGPPRSPAALAVPAAGTDGFKLPERKRNPLCDRLGVLCKAPSDWAAARPNSQSDRQAGGAHAASTAPPTGVSCRALIGGAGEEPGRRRGRAGWARPGVRREGAGRWRTAVDGGYRVMADSGPAGRIPAPPELCVVAVAVPERGPCQIKSFAGGAAWVSMLESSCLTGNHSCGK